METLQAKFDNNPSHLFSLSSGEYEGPLVIKHPCTLDGNMSTIWCHQAPVISIQSTGVTIKNLRVELLGEHGQEAVALETKFEDVNFYNVEVNHGVSGLSSEKENELPNTFSMGVFAANEMNDFSLVLKLTSSAEIINDLQDIEVIPNQLTRGINVVTIRTRRLRDNTIIYGSLFVKTNVLHRINLFGKASSNAAIHSEGNPPLSQKIKDETVPHPVPSPPTSEIPKITVMRGQRLTLKSHLVDIAILDEDIRTVDNLDCYIFSLLEQGKIGSDEDVVFFGNRTSPCLDVILKEDSHGATINLSKTQERISKIAVCFSFYGDDPSENFSKLRESKILVICGIDAYLFPMGNFLHEKTVVGVELYRYKNEWKINFIGAGFRYGAKKLCEGYGVTVE